jgi:hypothetical protein
MKILKMIWGGAMISSLVLSPLSAFSQIANLKHTLFSPNPVASDIQFGTAIAISGSKLLIGAPFHDLDGLNQNKGAAYIFDAATATLLNTLSDPDPSFGSFFGTSVSISEDKAIVGAPANYVHPGSVQLFETTSGSHLSEFVGSNPADDDFFGISVGVSGNNVLIGALDEPAEDPRTGSGYFFNSETKELRHRVFNEMPDDLDHFGEVVAISGDRAVIGAYGEDFPQGKAYLYDVNTGGIECELLNPNGWSTDINRFGKAVAISGTYVLIGAPSGAFGNQDTSGGAAYLFDSETCELVGTFLNPIPDTADNFGDAVAIHGDKIVVGAPGHNEAGSNDVGAAYLFDAESGELLQTLKNQTPGAGDQFGKSVAISASYLAVSAWRHDSTEATNKGAVYVFSLMSAPTERFIVNIDSSVYGDPASGLPTLNISFGPGTWLVTPTNPSIDSEAIFTAWSPWSSGIWSSAIQIETSSSKYSTGTFSHSPSPEEAFYNPANLPIIIELNHSESISFFVRDWELSDNLGGISLRFEQADTDFDGILNNEDNCPLISNPSQTDNELDGIGDLCDADDDNDGVLDTSDNCPFLVNSDQTDYDLDTIGDLCDDDDDNDGILDQIDNCPFLANADQSDADEDGLGDICDADPDGDGILEDDNCPYIPNYDQTNSDDDLLGDACDPDDDNDGLADENDNCSVTANSDQADLDDDNIGDACDNDIDGDGVLNESDNCIYNSNVGQQDADIDSTGDACDPDDDNDSIPDADDNCQYLANQDQIDSDQDGKGDICDNDLDGDGIGNSEDNCPDIANGNQADWDLDNIGDACDLDIDGDDVLSASDECEFSEMGQVIDPSNGCSIVQLVPCDGPRGTIVDWKNHGQYVSTLTKTTKDFVSKGLITDDERQDLIEQSASLDCGK